MPATPDAEELQDHAARQQELAELHRLVAMQDSQTQQLR
jgi:hypothetical protein